MKYTPKTIHEVRRCIAGFSGETRVEVQDGIPVKAKTVADLRALSSWPPGDWIPGCSRQRGPTIQRGDGGVAFLYQSLIRGRAGPANGSAPGDPR